MHRCMYTFICIYLYSWMFSASVRGHHTRLYFIETWYFINMYIILDMWIACSAVIHDVCILYIMVPRERRPSYLNGFCVMWVILVTEVFTSDFQKSGVETSADSAYVFTLVGGQKKWTAPKKTALLKWNDVSFQYMLSHLISGNRLWKHMRIPATFSHF